MQDRTDPWLNTPAAFQDTCRALPLPGAVSEMRKETRRVLGAHFRVRRDDGTTGSFPAWRSHHDDVRGPYKGGIGFQPRVDQNEVKACRCGGQPSAPRSGRPWAGPRRE